MKSGGRDILSDVTGLRRTSWQAVSYVGLPDHSRGQLTHVHFQFVVIGSLGHSATQWPCGRQEGVTVQRTKIDASRVATECHSSPTAHMQLVRYLMCDSSRNKRRNGDA